MIVIDTTKTDKKAAYFWDSVRQRFGQNSIGCNHGFAATHKILVDGCLTAQQLDKIFKPILLKGKQDEN